MTYENRVLWQKIAPDIAKSIQEKLKARDLEWGSNELAFTANGGSKKVKLKIILE